MTEKPALKNVMLIDDGEADQMLYKRTMMRSGQVGRVLQFEYADEALEYLKKEGREEIDVIFLDINMPRMDGFEFLEEACADFGDSFTRAVIIMLTTSLNPKDRERAAQFDVVKDFIDKPLTVEHIDNIVQLVKGQQPF